MEVCPEAYAPIPNLNFFFFKRPFVNYVKKTDSI